MKFVWHWEWVTEDFEKIQERSNRFEKALKDHPEEFPKLSEIYFTGRGKGFRIIEAENEEQLTNLVVFWWPTEKWNLVPYFERIGFSKAWDKWNK